MSRLFKQKFSVGAKAVDPLDKSGWPTMLIVGSVTNLSNKDALAYVKGQADMHLTVPGSGMFRIIQDRVNKVHYYELHEGGPGFSILDKVKEHHEQELPVVISLANGMAVSIEHISGAIYSLMYHLVDEAEEDSVIAPQNTLMPSLPPAKPMPVMDFMDGHRLSPLIPLRKGFLTLGLILMGVSVIPFVAAMAFYTAATSGVLDEDALLALGQSGKLTTAHGDNPVWQLERARNASAEQKKILASLKKEAGAWTWEFK